MREIFLVIILLISSVSGASEQEDCKLVAVSPNGFAWGLDGSPYTGTRVCTEISGTSKRITTTGFVRGKKHGIETVEISGPSYSITETYEYNNGQGKGPPKRVRNY